MSLENRVIQKFSFEINNNLNYTGTITCLRQDNEYELSSTPITTHPKIPITNETIFKTPAEAFEFLCNIPEKYKIVRITTDTDYHLNKEQISAIVNAEPEIIIDRSMKELTT